MQKQKSWKLINNFIAGKKVLLRTTSTTATATASTKAKNKEAAAVFCNSCALGKLQKIRSNKK